MKKILVVTMILVLGMSSGVFAASARWNALGGEHRFILDTSNYAIYPGRMLQFANALWIIPRYPYLDNDVASGLLVRKDDCAWAIHYNLPHAEGLSALRAALPTAGGNLHRLVADLRGLPDLFVARKMGDMTVAGRVVLGLASNEFVTDKTTSAISVDVSAGVTMCAGLGDLDVGARVSKASFSDESQTPKIESTGGIGVNVDARLMIDKGEGKTLVPVLSAAFSSEPTVDGATEVSHLNGDVGIGMTCKSGKSLLVAGALLGLERCTDKPPVGAEVTETTMTVTYLGGYEKPITKWLIGRGGARATLTLVSGDVPASKSSTYYYNFGIRATYKKVLLDALLDRAFLHRGPYILTGSGGSWSSNICLTYLL